MMPHHARQESNPISESEFEPISAYSLREAINAYFEPEWYCIIMNYLLYTSQPRLAAMILPRVLCICTQEYKMCA